MFSENNTYLYSGYLILLYLFSAFTEVSHRGLDSADTLDTVLAELVMSNVL